MKDALRNLILRSEAEYKQNKVKKEKEKSAELEQRIARIHRKVRRTFPEEFLELVDVTTTGEYWYKDGVYVYLTVKGRFFTKEVQLCYQDRFDSLYCCAPHFLKEWDCDKPVSEFIYLINKHWKLI